MTFGKARPTGTSVSEFAKQIGVSPSSVRRWEAGGKISNWRLRKLVGEYRAETPVKERVKVVKALKAAYPDRPILTALFELLFIGNDAPLRYQQAANEKIAEIEGLKLAA